MQGDTKHINATEVSQDELIAYLKGSVSVTEKNRIEAAIANNPFLQDAYDGLKNTEVPAIEIYQSKIQAQLQKDIRSFGKKNIHTYQKNLWILVFIIIICITVIGYFILHKSVK